MCHTEPQIVSACSATERQQPAGLSTGRLQVSAETSRRKPASWQMGTGALDTVIHMFSPFCWINCTCVRLCCWSQCSCSSFYISVSHFNLKYENLLPVTTFSDDTVSSCFYSAHFRCRCYSWFALQCNRSHQCRPHATIVLFQLVKFSLNLR